MKILHAALAPLFLAALLPVTAFAEFTVPSLTGPVVDGAGMLSPSTVSKLSGFIRRVQESGGPQLQVATVPDLGGLSIEEASIKITDQWKLGGAKTDNGVLLLIARDDRKIRIEVGQGLEGSLTDAYSSRIIRDVMTPQFRSGNVDGGVVSAVFAIVRYTYPEFFKNDDTGAVPAAASQGGKGIDLEFLLMIFFFTFLILPALFGKRHRRRGFWLGGGGFGGGGFGGGFGGGGGWSGGGGGFSGGGASGGW